jgi:GrpB-like predicted nucleotidyltransferase (UPF0157 family)
MRPTVVDDLDLLGSWFADPNFVAWWGGRPKSRDEVERKYVTLSFEPDATVLIGGTEPAVIILAEYDPAWPRRFEAERSHIDKTLRGAAKMIDHIGSTSVPGLAAKPIIDILVAVDDAEDEDAYLRPLENAGYALRVREPGHRMFRTPMEDVHVHIWSERAEIERHVAFRDWLRASGDDRRLYERVKRELAQREWSDTNEYAKAKNDIIGEIMSRARPAPKVSRERPRAPAFE